MFCLKDRIWLFCNKTEQLLFTPREQFWGSTAHKKLCWRVLFERNTQTKLQAFIIGAKLTHLHSNSVPWLLRKLHSCILSVWTHQDPAASIQVLYSLILISLSLMCQLKYKIRLRPFPINLYLLRQVSENHNFYLLMWH